MRQLVLVLAFASLAALPACKSKSAAAGGGKSELVTKLDALADRACACKDFDCAEKARAELDDLAAHTTNVADDDVAPAQAAQQRFDACHASLDPIVIDYKGIIDEACACADKACAEKASAKVTKWGAALKSSGKKLDGRDAQQLIEVGKHGGECFTKLGVAIPR